MCVCVCVCVRERESERKKYCLYERERERERERVGCKYFPIFFAILSFASKIQNPNPNAEVMEKS